METIYSEYLPKILQKTKEFNGIGQSVDAYFNGVTWPEFEQQTLNQFIETCDSDGLSYYEKLCGLTPSAGDSLEARKAMVLAKWSNQLPYNYDSLVSMLASICGEGDFELITDLTKLTIGVLIKAVRNLDEVKKLLNSIVPCNVVTEIYNEITRYSIGNYYASGAVTHFKSIKIGG